MVYILALFMGSIVVFILWYRDKKCKEHENGAKMQTGKKCDECGAIHQEAEDLSDNCTRAQELFDKAMEYQNCGEYAQAVAMFADAKKMGHKKARTMYGTMLLGGMGVEQNIEEGLANIDEAAKCGETVALYFMAECYENGEYSPIIKKDENRAKSYMEQVAETGFDEAQLKLAKMYANGIGGEVNNKLAVHWLGEAAAQGNDEAEYLLGLAYAAGIGVEKNMELAIAWWLSAAEHGNQDAKNEIKELNV